MSGIDPGMIEPAVRSHETMRDEIARIIDPYAWFMRDTAVAPYRRGTGCTGDEGWIYEVTWARGLRTVEEVDAWLRTGEPLHHEHTYNFHLQFQRSLAKADAVLLLIESTGGDRP